MSDVRTHLVKGRTLVLVMFSDHTVAIASPDVLVPREKQERRLSLPLGGIIEVADAWSRGVQNNFSQYLF